jgi:hypothetical protein
MGLVQPGMHFQALLGAGGTDQIHDDVQSFERDSLPVAGDVAKQPMLDLIPFASP